MLHSVPFVYYTCMHILTYVCTNSFLMILMKFNIPKCKRNHEILEVKFIRHAKQVDVLPSKNQALCCKLNLLIYCHSNVL